MFRSGLGFSSLRKWARMKRLLRSGLFSGLLLVCSCSNPNPPKSITSKQNPFEDIQNENLSEQAKLANLPKALIQNLVGRYRVLEEKCRLDNFIIAPDQELHLLDLQLQEVPRFELSLTEEDAEKNILTEMLLNADSYSKMLWSDSNSLFWSNCSKQNLSDNCSLRKLKAIKGPGIANLAYEIKTQFKIGEERHIYRCEYLLSK